MPSIKLFKTFSGELIKSLNIKLSREYYYIDDSSEKCFLEEQKVDPLANNDKHVKLEDKNRLWTDYRKSNSLFVNLSLSLNNICFIFHGAGLKSCDSKTRLGIGLSWKGENSKFKYCKKLGEIDDLMDDFLTTVEDIEIKCPDSNTDFYLFFYVVKPGGANTKEGYANSEGMIVSFEHSWTIMVSGSGSIFPIEEYAKPGDPLWHTRVDFEDWSEDEFNSDNLAIVLNPTHPLYPKINYESEEYDENILKEVLSSALASLVAEIMIIAKEKDQDDRLYKDQLESKGSILSAIRYLKSTLKFEVDKRLSELEKSIKIFFDKERNICK